MLWRAGDECSYCVCVLEGTLHGMQPSRKAGSADRLACHWEAVGALGILRGLGSLNILGNGLPGSNLEKLGGNVRLKDSEI